MYFIKINRKKYIYLDSQTRLVGLSLFRSKFSICEKLGDVNGHVSTSPMKKGVRHRPKRKEKKKNTEKQ